MVSKRRLHFVRFYDRRRLRKDSHRIRCVYFRKQRRRSSEGFSTITLFKKEQPKKPPADALDAVCNRQLGSVQKAFFFSTGRVGEETGLLRLNQVFVHQTKSRLAKAGGLLWYGRGGHYLLNVTLAPYGIEAPSRSSEGFSTLTLVKDLQPAKAPLPMLVTLFGIVMLVKDLHS